MDADVGMGVGGVGHMQRGNYLHASRAPRPGTHYPAFLFRNRNFVLCTVTGLIIMLGMMGTTSYLPTYFQIVVGLLPEQAALMSLLAEHPLATNVNHTGQAGKGA